MNRFVPRTKAAPVYGFLSATTSEEPPDCRGARKRILECGAGGAAPPLALFYEHDFEAFGIDASRDQVERAREYCRRRGIGLHLWQADMRHIPVQDHVFDFVYEHYSICHLSKEDTSLALSEMCRVLKAGGMCFLGVISSDTWPRSAFGEERGPGEYWGIEDSDQATLHSLFSDREADALVSAWETVSKEARVTYLLQDALQTGIEEWMRLRREAYGHFSPRAWREEFRDRSRAFRYVHLYYTLRKT